MSFASGIGPMLQKINERGGADTKRPFHRQANVQFSPSHQSLSVDIALGRNTGFSLQGIGQSYQVANDANDLIKLNETDRDDFPTLQVNWSNPYVRICNFW